MRILLSGPPSSGKSTQGRRLAAALGIPHVSSGELIRAAAAKGRPADVKILEMVSDGSLAPSGAIAHMVGVRLGMPDCENGFLLDGFPRRPIEAAFVTNRYDIDALLVMEAETSVLLSRVHSRAAAGRRDDDPEHFPRRIAAFDTETREAHGEISRCGIPVVKIDANGTAEETAALVAAAVEKLTFMQARSLRPA